MAAQYQLVMHSGPTPGKIFPLVGDIIIIGREADNGIVINDAEISRKHTQLVLQGGKYIVTDLGSTNGTFVNGQRLAGQRVLIPGEMVSLGEQISLLFEAVGQMDPNATVIQSAHSAAPRTVVQQSSAQNNQYQPQYQPAPAPYAGQVPAGPPPMPMPIASAQPKANNSRIIIIVVGLVLLLMTCFCIGTLWYIDSTNNWCTFLPFLFSAGTCGG